MPAITHAPNCQCCDAAQHQEHQTELVATQERDDGGHTDLHRCIRCGAVKVEIHPAHGKTTSRWIAKCAENLLPNPTPARAKLAKG